MVERTEAWTESPKAILQKSGLPHKDLCQIWDLADMDDDGPTGLQ